MCISSVVVLIVHDIRSGAFEAEREPPVLIDPNGPFPRQVALQWVQSPAWPVHVPGAAGDVEATKLQPQSRGMLRLNTSFRASFEEAFQPAMAEASNQLRVYRMTIRF